MNIKKTKGGNNDSRRYYKKLREFTSGKQLRFSHDPRKYHDCALEWEWNYIKNKLNIDEFDVDDILIYREDGFWYVEK